MHKINQKVLKSYNAMRGICALGIVLSHMSYLADSNTSIWKLLYSYVFKHFAAFTTFFMISSGFFMYYSYHETTYYNYILSRIKKIYPLTLTVFIIALIISIVYPNTIVTENMILYSPKWIYAVMANIFLFKAYVPDKTIFYSFHGPSWYISVLFGLYCVGYPVVKNLRSKGSNKYRKLLKYIIIISYTIEIAICSFCHFGKHNTLWLCYIAPFFRIFGEGFLGIYLCDYLINKNPVKHSSEMMRILSLLSIIIFVVMRNSKLYAFYAVLQSIPFALFHIYFFSDEGKICKIARMNIFQKAGKYSFELYMTHAFVYEGIPIIARYIDINLYSYLKTHVGIRLLVTIILSYTFAIFIYYTFKQSNKNHNVNTNKI